MKLHTYKVISKTEESFGKGILDSVNLSNQYCGLFRCPLEEAYKILPELSDLFNDANDMLLNENHDPVEWEMDLKIHMLMEGQFPCIPNWHCGNVPRTNGETRYDLVEDNTQPMYLWLSDNPTTEFLKTNWSLEGKAPSSHGELADTIRSEMANGLEFEPIPSQTWISMDQQTPHRGTVCKENTWRVFVRLTHKSITPVRPVNNYTRRHCQVYLDATKFSW